MNVKASSSQRKRVFDLLVSVPAVVVLSPGLAVIAAAIRLDSRGPAFFRQERVGLNGSTFQIHKFRTMQVAHSGPLVSTTTDSRVTRVGRLLRRTKLDELPQLIDVIVGTMSLVGPRPEVPRYVAHWPAESRAVILSVRPGITDPASVAFRNESDILASAADPERYYVDNLLPEKSVLYVEYVKTQSLLGDFRLLWHTIVSVVKGA